MKIYNYNNETEFISESEAKKSPLENDVYLIPANATSTKPLEAKEGFAVCFNGEYWEYKEDNRGKTIYNDAEGEFKTVILLGEVEEGYRIVTDEEIEAINNPPKTEAELLTETIANYKTYYSEVWNNKLAELDYDDLASVAYWKGTAKDRTYEVEAAKLSDWYEAMITFNYDLLNKVKEGELEQPTKEEYLALLPKYEGL